MTSVVTLSIVAALANGLLIRFQGMCMRLLGILLLSAIAAHGSVTLLLEEPYGHFGGMNPTGHAAIYLSHVCADTPISLRPCHEGEQGVVISRYHRISGYDWIAIPLVPYLYAVDRPSDVPQTVSPADVAMLRDRWRRANLSEIVPDAGDGSTPEGDWTQLVGSAYDRTLYAFEVPTTEEQDDHFVQALNAGPNDRSFSLLFHNCADFARHTIDFFYPHAVHRSLIADMGIMTPKQAAISLMSYGKGHNLPISVLVIPQVAGTVPRSTSVRGVLESLVKSKRYAVPLASVAALHPVVGGSLAIGWLEGRRFDPRRIAAHTEQDPDPGVIASELQSDQFGAGGQ
jgi:hypothetical protein